jgi:hypothetical protein
MSSSAMKPKVQAYAKLHREFLENHHPETFKTLKGIVRANSFTLPKRQNRISRPLIFLHFSGSI